MYIPYTKEFDNKCKNTSQFTTIILYLLYMIFNISFLLLKIIYVYKLKSFKIIEALCNNNLCNESKPRYCSVGKNNVYVN